MCMSLSLLFLQPPDLGRSNLQTDHHHADQVIMTVVLLQCAVIYTPMFAEQGPQQHAGTTTWVMVPNVQDPGRVNCPLKRL